MKTLVSFSLVIGLTLSIVPAHAEEIDSLVRDEMKTVFDAAQTDLAKAKRKDEELKGSRERAVAASEKQAKMDEVGLGLMNNYMVLLNARYVNEKSELQYGQELSAKDQDYINKIFDRHLRTVPLHGKSSVGEAQRWLNWGMVRIAELMKVHSTPTETNNSELEIIAYQANSNGLILKKATDRVAELSQKLGTKITDGNSKSERQPSSDK